jgi:DNA-binding phage protein
MFPLSAANVNYTNANEVTTTVEAHLREIDKFDPTKVLQNISDITKNINDTIDDVKDIAESIEHITEIAGTAIGVAEVAEVATFAIGALE